jgi:hypothetical protein
MVWQECFIDAQVTPNRCPVVIITKVACFYGGGVVRRVTVVVKVVEVLDHDKGFLIAYAIVCDLTHDVDRSRVRGGTTASFPDLFSTSAVGSGT